MAKKYYKVYNEVLKSLGGKKWLKTATPEEKARLDSLRDIDELHAICKDLGISKELEERCPTCDKKWEDDNG